jgi:hypothetical protein
MYSSLQASNSYFFARVLFSIDNTLQIHQQSFSNTKDHLSINDLILLMEDALSSILRHNFHQHLPKSIFNKFQFLLDKDNSRPHLG